MWFVTSKICYLANLSNPKRNEEVDWKIKKLKHEISYCDQNSNSEEENETQSSQKSESVSSDTKKEELNKDRRS